MHLGTLMTRQAGALLLALLIPAGGALAQQDDDAGDGRPRWEPSGDMASPMMGGRNWGMGQGMSPGMGQGMGHGMGQGMMGGPGRMGMGRGPMAWMDALNLSAEQKDQLQAMHRRHRLERLEAQGRVHTARRALHGVAHQFEPDLAAVEAAFDLLTEARKAALMQRLKARAEVDAVLTESQRMQRRGLGGGHGGRHQAGGPGGKHARHQGAMGGGGMSMCGGGMGGGMGMSGGMGMKSRGMGSGW